MAHEETKKVTIEAIKLRTLRAKKLIVKRVEAKPRISAKDND